MLHTIPEDFTAKLPTLERVSDSNDTPPKTRASSEHEVALLLAGKLTKALSVQRATAEVLCDFDFDNLPKNATEAIVLKPEPSPNSLSAIGTTTTSATNTFKRRVQIKEEPISPRVKFELQLVQNSAIMTHHDGEYILNQPFGKSILRGENGFYANAKGKQFSQVRTNSSGKTTGKWFWIEDSDMSGRFQFQVEESGSVKGTWGWYEKADGGGEISGNLVSRSISPTDEKVISSIEKEHQKSLQASPDSKNKARQMLEMMGRGRRVKKKKKKWDYYDDDEDFHPDSYSAPESEDYQSDKASDEQILMARSATPIKSYGNSPPADIKSVSDRQRTLYYKRFCELIRVGLVPEQIYPVMSAEAEERNNAAKAAYDQDIADEKRKQQQATLNMWMQSQADETSSQGQELKPPSPVKMEKPHPMDISMAGSSAPLSPSPTAQAQLSFSPSQLPPLPPQVPGSPQPIAGQVQTAWWMSGQPPQPSPLGTANPLNPYDSPKVGVKTEQTLKLSPVKTEGGVVNPYAPSETQPVRSAHEVHRAIEALDGRKNKRHRKGHSSSELRT